MARFTRVFGVPKLRVDFVRGLRFRLALSYVIFFTVLLVLIGLAFRKNLQLEMDGDVEMCIRDREWIKPIQCPRRTNAWATSRRFPTCNYLHPNRACAPHSPAGA